MITPLIVVDGKNSQGKRISVSIDEALWSLFIASRSYSSKQARIDIKQRMHQGLILNTYDVKKWIYREIANPVLLEADNIAPIESILDKKREHLEQPETEAP